MIRWNGTLRVLAVVAGFGTCVACGGAPATPGVGVVQTTEAAPAAPLAENNVGVQGAPALLAEGITSFGAATLGDDVYLLGGFQGTPHHYVPEGQSKALLRLNTREQGASWESLPGLHAGLQSVALVNHGEVLHRLGGMRATGLNVLESVDEHERFVPSAEGGHWEPAPAMPEARSSHDAINHGGSIYVVGGWQINGNPREGTFFDDLWVYSDDAGWQRRESPVQRRALALASTESALVAIGGLTPEAQVSDKVDIYYPAEDRWVEGPALPGERTGFGVAAIGVGNVVYANGFDGVVWRLDLSADNLAWERAGELVFPRFFHRLVQDGDSLLVIGGIGGMHTAGRTRHVERFDLTPSAESRLVLWELPSPVAARNRQGVLLHGDELLVFGGNNSMGQHDFAPENFLADARRIHIPSLNVSEAAAYPASRQTMQTLVVGDKGLSVGGFGHDGEVARTHREAFAYDFDANRWSEAPGLPVARSQFGLAAAGEDLWVFGGLDYDPTRPEGEHFAHLTEVLRAPADGSAEFAESGVELPGPRRAFGGATLGGKYYIVGGMREGFQLVDDCYAFDFEGRSFESIACPAHVRLNPQLVTVGEKLVLLGGTTQVDGELTEDKTIEVYDPASNTWSVLDLEVPFSPKHMRAFAYRGQLLIYSAHNDDNVVRLGLIALGSGEGSASVRSESTEG